MTADTRGNAEDQGETNAVVLRILLKVKGGMSGDSGASLHYSWIAPRRGVTPS
jgi:hypothetical protein